MIDVKHSVRTGISWSGIFAGVVVGLTALITLSTIGLAFAGQTLSVSTFAEVSTASLIWGIVCLSITGFVGGYVASSSSGELVTNSAGLSGGLTCGAVLFLSLSLFTYNLLASTVSGTAALVQQTAQGVATATTSLSFPNVEQLSNSQSASSGALSSVLPSLSEREIENIIAEVSPELSSQQVSATAATVMSTLREVRQDIQQGALENPSQLDEVVKENLQFVRNELTGEQFASQLASEGLSRSEATEVMNVLENRIDQLESASMQIINSAQRNIEQFGNQTAETVRSGVTSGAISWLIASILLVGLGATGGRMGADGKQAEDAIRFSLREQDSTHRGASAKIAAHE